MSLFVWSWHIMLSCLLWNRQGGRYLDTRVLSQQWHNCIPWLRVWWHVINSQSSALQGNNIQKNPWGSVISRRGFWIKGEFVFSTVLVIEYSPLTHWKLLIYSDLLDNTSVIHNASLNKPGFAVKIIVPFIDTQFTEI